MNGQMPATSTRTPNQQLALNVTAALRVAGPSISGQPKKLRPVDILRRTRMSRTTLRPLLDPSGSAQRSPDLATLQKLAQAIGVPIAFLLMTPSDWRALIKAVGAFSDYQAAAHVLVTDGLASPVMAEAILKRCKVHPERPPLGGSYAPAEIERLNLRNEWRRRCSAVLAALAQPAARGDHRPFVDLTALAAALANEMTPHNPMPDENSQDE